MENMYTYFFYDFGIYNYELKLTSDYGLNGELKMELLNAILCLFPMFV